MALKVLVDSLDSVEDFLRDHYIEKDGKFVLQLDGVRDHPETQALKAALDRVRQEKKDTTDKLTDAERKLSEIPEGFDAEEYLSLKAGAGDPNDPLKKKATDEHLQSQKALYEQRIANLTKKHETDLADRDAAITERDGYIDRTLVQGSTEKALRDAGVAEEFLEGALGIVLKHVKVRREDNGDRKAVVETDLGETDIAAYASNWAQSDKGKPYLAKPSGPGGNGNNGRGGTAEVNPWAKDTFNLTKQGEIARTDPAKTQRFKAAAGVA